VIHEAGTLAFEGSSFASGGTGFCFITDVNHARNALGVRVWLWFFWKYSMNR